jgi:hypothetical protein
VAQVRPQMLGGPCLAFETWDTTNPNYPFPRDVWPIFGLSVWDRMSQTPSKSSLFTLKNTLFARICAYFALDLNLLALMQHNLSRHSVRL